MIKYEWISEKELRFDDDESAEIVNFLINAHNDGKTKLRKVVSYVLEGVNL